MKTTFHKNLKAFTLCAGFFSLVACKEKSTIKPDLIPGIDSINTIEVSDLSMSVQNSYFDSLQTNDYTYPYVAIGGITGDPFYGKTNAGVYMQFVPPAESFSFPAGTIIDSSFLSVPFAGFGYGDTARSVTSPALHLKAYQITENFELGDGTIKYYAFNKKTYNPTPVGSGSFSMKSLYNDTLYLPTGDTATRLLRMRVDALNNTFLNMGADLSSTTAFLQRFKGIYLAPDSTVTQNALGYFALFNGNTTVNYSTAQLEFYAHTATDPVLRRYFFRFSATYSSFFNGIYRNYNGFKAASYMANQAAVRDSLLIQGYPGFQSDLTVKFDNKIPPAVINKAVITITALKVGDDARFSAPQQLNISVIEDDGTERAPADLLNNDGSVNSSGLSFVGGGATKVKINGTDFVQYTLNIPREIQKAISAGKTQLKLRLASSITYPAAFRMVADGPNSSNADTRLKFSIIYTKLK